MARVFVLEKMNEKKRHISLEEAGDYGELLYVFDGKENRPSIWAEEYKHEVIRRFKDLKYKADEDYFCIAGYFVPMVIAVSELIVEYGEIRALLYSAVEQHYLPRRLGAKYESEITGNGERDRRLPSGDLSKATES